MLLTFIETCQLLKSFAWNFWVFVFHSGHDPHWGNGWASIRPEERCHKLYVTFLNVSWLASVEKNQCFRSEGNENCNFLMMPHKRNDQTQCLRPEEGLQSFRHFSRTFEMQVLFLNSFFFNSVRPHVLVNNNCLLMKPAAL